MLLGVRKARAKREEKQRELVRAGRAVAPLLCVVRCARRHDTVGVSRLPAVYPQERVSGVITGKRREKKGAKYHDRRRKMLSHRKGAAGVSDLQGGTMRNGILFVKNT